MDLLRELITEMQEENTNQIGNVYYAVKEVHMDILITHQSIMDKLDKISEYLVSLQSAFTNGPKTLHVNSETIEPESSNSVSSQTSSVSYVPPGLKSNSPMKSVSDSIDDASPPINQIVSKNSSQIRLTGSDILCSRRANSKWLQRLENFHIEDVTDYRMNLVRSELRTGSDNPRRLFRKLALIIYDDDIIRNYGIGNDDSQNALYQNQRQILPAQEEKKLKDICQFIDEFYCDNYVYNELVRVPFNQLGHYVKTKTKLQKPGEKLSV